MTTSGRTLLVNGHIYSMSERFATAMLLDAGTVAWIGTDVGAEVHVGEVEEVVDLAGDLIAPGFVHLNDPEPAISQGFVHGSRPPVPVAHGWTESAWDAASGQPLAVVPRDPCRLRSRITAGVATALVPAPADSGGWATIRAAVHEIAPEQRISARAAFSALTRGAWRLLGRPDQGVLTVGCDATFVQWAVADLVVEAPDERISNWSTDPRAATPGLPPLGDSAPLPQFRCVWRRGAVE